MEDQSAPRRWLKISRMYISSCVPAEGRVVDSSMDSFYSFSSNLFAVLVYHLEVGDVGMGVVTEDAVYVN